VFVCNDWIKVHRDISKRNAKTLKLDTIEESHLTAVHSTQSYTINTICIESVLNLSNSCRRQNQFQF